MNSACPKSSNGFDSTLSRLALTRERIDLVGLGRGGVGRFGGFRFTGCGPQLSRSAGDPVGASRKQVVLLQRQADTPLHFAHGLELFARQGPDLDRVNHFGSLDGIDSEYLRIAHE